MASSVALKNCNNSSATTVSLKITESRSGKEKSKDEVITR